MKVTLRRHARRHAASAAALACARLRRFALAMRLALYEPDIPQNTGALLRLGACLGVAIDIIEPCGFVLSDRRLKRAATNPGRGFAPRRGAGSCC
jgi:hypothetical protein